MKKSPLLLFLLPLFLHAQKGTDTLLIGSWELKGYTTDTKTNSAISGQTYSEITSFYGAPNWIYQRTYTTIVNDSEKMNTDAGFWSINEKNKMLLYYNRHPIPPIPNLSMENFSSTIYFIDDTLLILSGNEGKQIIYTHYKRIPTFTPIPDEYAFTSYQAPISPYYEFYFVNSVNPKKKRYINNNSSTQNITYIENNTDSITNEKKIKYNAFVKNIDDTFLTLNVFSQEEYITYKNRSDGVFYSYSTLDYENGAMQKIKIQNIKYFQYSSPAKDFCMGFGGTVLTLGILTPLIAAPLFSLDFKDGTFNKEKYFKISAMGLAGIGIGTTFMILGKPKKYKVIDKNGFPYENNWYIQKELGN